MAINIQKLTTETKTAGLPLAGLSMSETDGDQFSIVKTGVGRFDFTRALTGPEVSTLNTVITAHNPTDFVKQTQDGAEAAAAGIPNWATYNETIALTWIDTNITQPLATPIPANPMTVQQIRAVLVSIVAIMGQMVVWMVAITRMVVALRNKTMPKLQQ